MNFVSFIKLIYWNLKWVVILPVGLAVAVFFLTRNEVKTYYTDTLFYTGIASGYNIESGENTRVDYHVVNSKFDNLLNTIKARNTYEEVSKRLLYHYLKEPDFNPNIILEETYRQLIENLGPSIAGDLRGLDSLTFYAALEEAVEQGPGNPVYHLIYEGESPFSLKTLGTIRAERVGQSDMIKISYRTTDPYLCQQTLIILLDVFSKKYKALQFGETSNVVEYFQKQVDEAKIVLKSAEDKLRNYRVQNRIINYYEQTSFISEQKEEIDNKVNEYRMRLAADNISLKRLEEKLGTKKLILAQNDKVLAKQKKLADLTSEIANTKAFERDNEKLDSLVAEKDSLTRDLGLDLETLYGLNHTTEGLPLENLLKEWLDANISYHENAAQLEVLEQRREEYQQQYDQFAPLGSRLSQLEREIDVAERAYLELLHSLNQSKLREQNLEVSGNISMIDKPKFPSQPEASKRMLLVISAGFGGLVISLVFLVLREYYDERIKTIEHAEQLTGQSPVSAFPDYARIPGKIFFDKMEHQLLQRLLGGLHYSLGESEQEGPKLILLYSLSEVPDMSYIRNEMIANFIPQHSVLVAPADQLNGKEAEMGIQVLAYPEEDHIFKVHHIADLAQSEQEALEQASFIFLQIPSMARSKIPIHLIPRVDHALHFMDASRKWTTQNKQDLQQIEKLIPVESKLVVCQLTTDKLESILDEIPKRRSRLRKFLKRLVNGNKLKPEYA